MTFHQAQKQSRRKGRNFIALFWFTVIATLALTFAIIYFSSFFLSDVSIRPGHVPRSLYATINTLALLHAAFWTGLLGFMLLIGYIRMHREIRDGASICELLGGRLVHPQTLDPLEKRLQNIVEEMSIASGVPIPAIYIFERESCINALIAGRSMYDVALGVTRGSLDKLERDELEAVIAHEYGHMKNGDMQLNVKVTSMIGAYNQLTLIRTKKGEALLLAVFGYLLSWIGRLLQSQISKSREFLADACALEYCRNAAAIEGALMKVAAQSEFDAQFKSRNGTFAKHFFFADIQTKAMFQTHPKVNDRLGALGLLAKRSTFKKEPSKVASAAVTTSPRKLDPNLEMYLNDNEGAKAAALGLLLTNNSEAREKQMLLATGVYGNRFVEKLKLGFADFLTISNRDRAIVQKRSLEKLVHLSDEEKLKLVNLAKEWVKADGQTSVREFVVFTELAFYLCPPKHVAHKKFKHFHEIQNQTADILAVSACGGAESKAKAEQTYQLGMKILRLNVPFKIRENFKVSDFLKSLDDLQNASGSLRRDLIDTLKMMHKASSKESLQWQLVRALAHHLRVPWFDEQSS